MSTRRSGDDEDETGAPDIAGSDLVLVVYGRDREERSHYLDQVETALGEMGATRIDRTDDNQLSVKLTDDALTMLDEIAGWTGDPPTGAYVQAGVIEANGNFIPISRAWETWEELLGDVEDNIVEYLNKYGEGE